MTTSTPKQESDVAFLVDLAQVQQHYVEHVLPAFRKFGELHPESAQAKQVVQAANLLAGVMAMTEYSGIAPELEGILSELLG